MAEAIVDGGVLAGRSSSAPKKAAAALRMALARFNSAFSRLGSTLK